MASTDMKQMLEHLQPKISDVISKHLTAERLTRVALLEMTRTPKLYECSAQSMAAAVMQCAILGLEPGGVMGYIHLIPRAGKVTIQLGYKGYIELARRTGRVKELNAGVFYEDDIKKGLFKASNEPATIEHLWSHDVNKDDKELCGAYAVAKMQDGSQAQIILSRDDLARRSAKAMNQGKSGPWKDDFGAMARKSAIKALLTGGLVDLSDELKDSMNVEPRETYVNEIKDEPLVIAPDASARTMKALSVSV